MEICEPQASEELNAARASQRGDDLHLSLDCPQCGASGWVRWTSLKRGMSCPKCGCHFHVASNGQLRSDDHLPRVRFHCPRCHQAGTIPATFKVRKAKCGSCKLPLEIGPDEQLHGAKEAAEMRRASSVSTSVPPPDWGARLDRFIQQYFFRDDGKMRTTNVILVGMLAVVLLVAVVAGAGSLFSGSVEGKVCSFTYTCLAGDWSKAEEFLPDDDIARVEFQRWRSFYFTSILDKHRPAGDSVQIVVEREGDNSTASVFAVTMTSPVIGNRTIRQCWRERDGAWEFDVVATLAAMQGG